MLHEFVEDEGGSLSDVLSSAERQKKTPRCFHGNMLQ